MGADQQEEKTGGPSAPNICRVKAEGVQPSGRGGSGQGEGIEDFQPAARLFAGRSSA